MAIRESGCVIMKMISSTSRMSIMGTTFGSDETSPRAPPPPPAISVLLLVFGGLAEQARLGGGLRDGRHHPHAGPPGGLHRFLDLAVLELVVRLEVEDLVLGPRREDRAQLVLEGAL